MILTEKCLFVQRDCMDADTRTLPVRHNLMGVFRHEPVGQAQGSSEIKERVVWYAIKKGAQQ